MRPKYHRNKWEKERDLADIATLFCKQKTQTEIAAWIAANRSDGYSLSQQAISRDIQEIKRRWELTMFTQMDVKRARELAKLEVIEREAWMAWERSQGEEISKSVTSREKDLGEDDEKQIMVSDGTITKTMTSRKQVGDARFLQLMLECIHKRAELLGLDAPKKIEGRIEQVTMGLPNDHVDRILREHYTVPALGNGHNGSQNGSSHPNGEGQPD